MDSQNRVSNFRSELQVEMGSLPQNEIPPFIEFTSCWFNNCAKVIAYMISSCSTSLSKILSNSERRSKPTKLLNLCLPLQIIRRAELSKVQRIKLAKAMEKARGAKGGTVLSTEQNEDDSTDLGNVRNSFTMHGLRWCARHDSNVRPFGS